MIPGPELPSMGMTRELKIEARFAGLEDALRVMGEEEAEVMVRGTGHGFDRIRCLFEDMAARRIIRTSRHEQPPTAMDDEMMSVIEDPYPTLFQCPAPGRRIPIILVISRAKEEPMPGPKMRDGLDLLPEFLNVAIDEITRDDDDVRTELVDPLHDGLDRRPADRGADVDITELDDMKSVQIGREPGDGDFDVDDIR